MGFNLDDYEPVASRIKRFWEEHPAGAIHTELVFDDGHRCVIKATVYFDSTGQPVSSDYAEELHTERGVNATSRIENCSTSAQGRALAAAGFLPSDWSKKPSREEMSKVANYNQKPYKPDPNKAPLTQAKRIESISQEGVFKYSDGTMKAPPNMLGVAIKGKQHGPLPEWFLQEAFAAGVAECWDNRDKVPGTKRPWFKDANGDKAFWPPKGTPDPVVEVETFDDTPEEPF